MFGRSTKDGAKSGLGPALCRGTRRLSTNLFHKAVQGRWVTYIVKKLQTAENTSLFEDVDDDDDEVMLNVLRCQLTY